MVWTPESQFLNVDLTGAFRVEIRDSDLKTVLKFDLTIVPDCRPMTQDLNLEPLYAWPTTSSSWVEASHPTVRWEAAGPTISDE